MKRMYLLVVCSTMLRFVAAAQDVPGLDTLTGRVDRYFYSAWYDECPVFSSDDSTDDFYIMSLSTHREVGMPAPMPEAKREYTPVPMQVKGLSVMILDRESHIYYTCGDRLPEYLILYQYDPTYPKSGMRPLDSVRWDTVVPKDLRMPKKYIGDQQAGYDDYMYCHVYEAYFPKPVTVDSTFFIGTTFNSNWKNDCIYTNRPVVLATVMPSANYQNGVRVCDNMFLWYDERDTNWYVDTDDVRPFGGLMAIVDQWNLTGQSADSSKGVVTGSGRYPDQSYDTLRAIPYAGYSFSHWNDGSTENPRVIYLTQDTSFTAYFDTGVYYTVTTAVNEAYWGTVEGGGQYAANTEVELRALPSGGFMFERWDDGDTENPRTVTLTQDTLFTAVFAQDTMQAGIAAAEALSFAVSPNPTGGELTVSTGSETPSQAEVYDASGRCVLRAELQGPKDVLDVRQLPAGRYLLRLSNGDRTGSRAFVKK